ncbi:MAG: replicative DNA helicase [Candidatus Colwellbacteria bacterium]|nr:replicative DNA helicase [Candidatus Colwellbacteria bacterium]
MARQSKELRIPPQDIEAEQSVLGALMIDQTAIGSVTDLLIPYDFYKKAHSIIFEAFLRLWEGREPIDILSTTTELKRVNILQEIGGVGYLTELVNSVPTATHVEHYAKIVKEKSILRDLINASGEIAENAFESAEELDDLLDRVEQKIFSISQKSIVRNFLPIREDLKEAYERIERLHHGEGERLRGVPTGFTVLDDILSGLQRSDFIVVGARPSYGKTAFVLDIARHIGVEVGAPVGIFSLEMSREQVTDRIIAAEAQVDLWKLRTGRLKDEGEFEMIQAALDRLHKAPLFIEDNPSPTVIQIRSMARRLQAEQGQLALLVVDYLQLIQPRKNYDSMVQQVTVSQLSRAVDQREIKIPRLSDLRESGSIEQDADVVLFVAPKGRGRIDTPPEEENVTDIIIAKHRNGPIGSVSLYFDKQKVSFNNLEKKYESTAAT